MNKWKKLEEKDLKEVRGGVDLTEYGLLFGSGAVQALIQFNGVLAKLGFSADTILAIDKTIISVAIALNKATV